MIDLPEPPPEVRSAEAPEPKRARGSPPSPRWAAWRPSIAVLVIVTSLTLTGGYVLKARCLDVPWDGRQWTTNCQNDIELVYALRGIADGHSFVPRNLEYPAGTVFYVGAAAVLSDSARGFFQANAAGIFAAGLATVAMLALLMPARRRVLLFALGPPLLLYAFQNWDLLAVALVVAGLLAAGRRRYGLAGAAVGFGAAAKLFPLLALPAVLLLIRRDEAEPRRGIVGSLLGFGGAFAGTNFLLYAISPASWRVFWSFQADRFPNPETSWFMVARHLEGMFPSQAWSDAYVRVANAGSLILLAVAGLVLTAIFFRARGRPPYALAFLLLVAALCTSKVFSPQYMLWLLPFFVLLPFPWYSYVVYLVADVAVLVSVNGYFTTIAAGGDWPHSLAILEVFTWLRYAALLWLAIIALRFREDDPAEPVRGPARTASRPRTESRLLHSKPGSG